jgi:hypothetical protein
LANEARQAVLLRLVQPAMKRLVVLHLRERAIAELLKASEFCTESFEDMRVERVVHGRMVPQRAQFRAV